MNDIEVTSKNASAVARYVLDNKIPFDDPIVKKLHRWFKSTAHESNLKQGRSWNIKLAQKFYDNGMDVKMIADKVGISYSTIQDAVYKGNIKVAKRKKLLEQQKLEVDSVRYELYRTGVVLKVGTINEIANYLGFQKKTVNNYLRRYSAVGYNLRKCE